MMLKFNHSAIEKDIFHILLPNISVILVEEGIQAIFKTIFYTIQFTASLQYSHATCAVLTLVVQAMCCTTLVLSMGSLSGDRLYQAQLAQNRLGTV